MLFEGFGNCRCSAAESVEFYSLMGLSSGLPAAVVHVELTAVMMISVTCHGRCSVDAESDCWFVESC